MTLVVNDTFTDANATVLTSHTGETGATWTKHSSSGTDNIQVQGNRICLSTGGGDSQFAYASGSPASAEYDVEADYVVVLDSGSQGRPRLLARVDTSAHTWYEVLWEGAFVILNEAIAGSVTQLGAYAIAASGGSIHVLGQFRNATKKVFIGGVERISDSTNNITAAGKAGVGFVGYNDASTGIHLDNFQVNDTVVAPPASYRRSGC